MTKSNCDNTPSPFPSGSASASPPSRFSWWQWIKSYGGLSDLKKYNAAMRKLNEEARKRHEEWLKNELRLEEEAERQHEEWLKNNQKQIDELKRQNARLAELELKLDTVLPRSGTS
ncbi:hypothetical protein GS597_01870 [Synechococcales cyanobacterium C]|uniref:Uncharacterized protein n=1 Tax=Petrachloros mirabilis ULC683 TaxID=2781853 RepID=A0A8K1ZWQ2_9CYAN|nr:hypothetical protein [Petrachloros mirabilis ULC683]